MSPFDQGHLDLLLAALDGQHDLYGRVFDPRYLRDLLLPVSGALLAAWLGVLAGLATLRAPAPAAAAALSALGLDASVTGAIVALAALASVAGRLRHAAPDDAGLALALAALLLAMLVSPASVLVVPLSLGEGPSSLLVGLCALTLAAEGLLSQRAGPAAPEVGPLLACGGMGAGVVSEEVAGLRVEWALFGGAGSGELLGWLVAGACAAALVAAAVALAAPRGRRASTLAPTVALLALSWVPVALGVPSSAWGAGRASLASLLPTALATGVAALAVRLGERGASRPRSLLALGAPALVGSAIVRSGSAPALSVPPVAAVTLVALGAAGLWRASRALSRRARAAQGGRLALVERGLCARGLTRAEARVAALLACGLGASAVASRLSVSAHTVAAQRRSAYRKLGVHAQAELTALAEEILLELR